MIPQAAPARRIARFRAEIDAAIASVLGGPTYILGAAVERFERDFAAYAGAPHCVGVASGTDALALALRALGIGPGDEVVTTALTFAGTAQAILHCGAKPRFAEVDPLTRCLSPGAVAASITSRTAAIMPVHLFGFPCDMPAIIAVAEAHGLAVVEDCAQSHGATLDGRPLGGFGHAAAYSFYPTKNLGCIGDGGAVTTRDPDLARRLRRLRNYGFDDASRISQCTGFNSRLDEMQAAILGALLPHLDAGNVERRAIAAEYRRRLATSGVGLPPDDFGCVHHQFAITCDDRDGMIGHLARNGIGAAIHYTPPLHRHPAFCPEVEAPPLPVTDILAARLLSLPIQPEIARPDLVATAIASFGRAFAHVAGR